MQALEFSFGERLDLVDALRYAIKGHEAALKGIERRGGTNAATRDARAKHEADVIDLGVLLTRVLLSVRPAEPESPFTVVGVWKDPVVRAQEIMDRLDDEDDDKVRADLLDEIIGLADENEQVAAEWEAYR